MDFESAYLQVLVELAEWADANRLSIEKREIIMATILAALLPQVGNTMNQEISRYLELAREVIEKN